MTFSEFKDDVDELLIVDADRKGQGMQTYKDKILRMGILDLQDTIEFYQKNHETLYTKNDVSLDGFASKGQIPNGANLQEAWLLRRDKDNPTTEFRKIDVGEHPWVERNALIGTGLSDDATSISSSCVSSNTCCCPTSLVNPVVAINPQVDTFYLSPQLEGAVLEVDTVTRLLAVVTVTTIIDHGYLTGNTVAMAGAVETDYNGDKIITRTGPKTFTYAIDTTPTTPATGTITVQEDDTIVDFILVWNGIKLSFADGDEVPFDEQMALPVSFWVKAHLELQMGEGGLFTKYKEMYRLAKASLYLQKRDMKSISRLHNYLPYENRVGYFANKNRRVFSSSSCCNSC